DQELRNAIYTGPWLADAKRWYPKVGGPAYALDWIRAARRLPPTARCSARWTTGRRAGHRSMAGCA
ncbi:MAG: hypothetical protein KGL21_06415, partial [Alphaproteobacteria bacterium]|nr:hypothetical protein [Alphaproteobacteria bacterium]